jgi:hypothetical protein
MKPAGSHPGVERRNFLARTRQMWKLRVVALSCVTAAALFLATTALARSESRWIVNTLPMVATLLGVLVFWGVLTVRCPACGARLLWKAAREQTPDSWWPWLSSLQTCPACGAVGDEPRLSARRSFQRMSWQPRTGYSKLTAACVGFVLAFSVATATMLVRVLILSVAGARGASDGWNLWAIASEVLPWLLGATAGGFIASRIAVRGRQMAAALSGALLLVGLAILWASESRPLWLWLAAPVVVVLSAAVGGVLGGRRAEGV